MGPISASPLPSLAAPVGRRQRRRAETRERIFRSALALFAEHGFVATTVEEITEAADVGKGTFFNYFDSKDHVLGVMAEIQLGKVCEALEQATRGKSSVQSVLRHLFERIAEEPGRSPDLARAVISSFLGSEVVRRQLDRNMAEGRGMIAQIVELGQQRGEIDSKLKKDQVALLLQQTLMGTILLWSLRGQPGLQNAVGASFQHFWRAVAVFDRAESQ